MSQIVINGRVYNGRSISINNGKIIIDGDISVKEESKTINIYIEGNVEQLSVDACEKVMVNGFVNTLSTMSGDVECGNVNQSVSTQSGDVECENVGGNISTQSGDIKAKNITGSVKTTTGDIKYVKDK